MRSSSQYAGYRACVPSVSPLVFYSNVSLKSDERCNHPDRSLRNASGRSSSRATTIPRRLRCGEPIRREDPYSRKESDLDSHTCRARLIVGCTEQNSQRWFCIRARPNPPREASSKHRRRGYRLSMHRYVYVFCIRLKSTRET